MIIILFRSCDLNREYISELKKQDSEIQSFKVSRLLDSSLIYSQVQNIKIKDDQLLKNEQEIFALRVMKMKKPRSIQRPKTRHAKELFTRDTPYGHKVQRDRTKTLPRKQKYKEDLSDR